MHKKYKYISVSVMILGMIVGGIWGMMLTIGQQSTAAQPKEFVAGSETNERIEQLKSELEKTAQYEMVYGCTENDQLGQKVFCGASKTKIDKLGQEIQNEILKQTKRSDRDIAEVKSKIKKIREDNSLTFEFQGKFTNPYTEKNNKKVEYYKDNKGIEYSVDPTTNEVIEFTDDSIREAKVKNIDMAGLRAKAEAYLQKNVADFDRVKKTFTFEGGGKGDSQGDSMIAFRWNAPEKVNGEEMVPFVMIKLSPSGKIIGFSDTRSLYK